MRLKFEWHELLVLSPHSSGGRKRSREKTIEKGNPNGEKEKVIISGLGLSPVFNCNFGKSRLFDNSQRE